MFRLIPHRAVINPRAALVEGDGAPGEQVVLKVDGLVCSLCAARVRQSLAEVPGVDRADVDLGTGTTRVAVGSAGVAPAALIEAVESTVVARSLRRLLAKVGGGLARDRH